MSAFIDDDGIIRERVLASGSPGDGFDDAAALQMRTDVDEILSRPAWEKLDDIPDVNAPAPADGNVLLYDAENGEWVTGTQQGTIAFVRDTAGPTYVDVNQLWFDQGLRVLQHPDFPSLIYVRPIYGTEYQTVAQGNHTHSIQVDTTLPFAETGTLSSGSRTLVTGTISGLDSTKTYVVKGRLDVDLRGAGTGAGYESLRIVIGGNTRNRFGQVRTVAGVDRPAGMNHPGVTVSGVSSVSVSAVIQYQSGDPVNVGAGELVLGIESNR